MINLILAYKNAELLSVNLTLKKFCQATTLLTNLYGVGL